MYYEFFGLKKNPFSPNPDPRFLFFTPQVKEALACLYYGIQSRRGFVLLTGEVGTGKTTVIHKLFEALRTLHVATAFVFNSRLDTDQFLDFIMADFGIACESRMKSQILLRLNEWLLARYRAGKSAVLIVDEAQNLSNEMLEEIRLLTNLETSTAKLLQIVLVGQPELEYKLKQPELRQLLQRITLRAKTHSLSLQDTEKYILQRLHLAGANGQKIFEEGATPSVHEFSQGIPRLINLLCDHSLINAFALQQKVVSADMVRQVAQDFELDPVPAAPGAEKGGFVGIRETMQLRTALAERTRRTEQQPLAERKI